MRGHERFHEMLARRGELPPRDEARLSDHLDTCPECRERAAAYARQAALLQALPFVDPPPTLRARVLAGITTATPAGRRLLPSLLGLAPLGAALAAAVLVFALLHRPGGPHHASLHPISTSPTPAVQPVETPVPTEIVKKVTPPRHRTGQPRAMEPTSLPQNPGTNPTPQVPPSGGSEVAQAPVPTVVPPPPTVTGRPRGHPATGSRLPSPQPAPTTRRPTAPVYPTTAAPTAAPTSAIISHPTIVEPPAPATPTPVPTRSGIGVAAMTPAPILTVAAPLRPSTPTPTPVP